MDNGNGRRRSQRAHLSITTIECIHTRPGFLLGRALARQDTTTDHAMTSSYTTRKTLVGCCQKNAGFLLQVKPQLPQAS